MPRYGFVFTVALPLAAFAAPAATAQSSLISPLAVLLAARHAQGLPSTGVLHAIGQQRSVGLDGKLTSTVDLATGRFAQRSDFGVFATGSLYDGQWLWKIDRSGGVHPLNGRFGSRNAKTDAWLASYGYLKPNAAGATLGPASERMDGGVAYTVFVATPPGGEPVELWFGTKDHLLSKEVRHGPISTTTYVQSDYRRAGPGVLPFRIRSRSNDGSQDQDTSISRYERFGAGALDFQKPASPPDTELARATTIPAQIDTYVVIEARLNRHAPMSFILDTGAHSILTPAAADALGLKAVGAGRSGGAGAETLAEQDVTVGEVKIGAATLRHQHFYVIPLQHSTIERGRRAPLAGMLGVELLERVAARIDYRQQTVTLAPSAKAAPLCEGASIPISFDDDMPLADGRIEGKPGVLAIDTGNSGSTVIQGVWAAKAGLAARFRRGIETTSFGSGGTSTNWITRGGVVDVGPVHVPNVDLRYAADKQGAFSSTTEAANIGQQILARFSATFDYAGGRMCLRPVPGYLPPPLNRSGLVLSKTSPDVFSVVSVTAGSLASAAGFKAGETVVAIDGKPASDLGGADLFKILRRPPGSSIHLKLSGGEERRIILAEPKS